MQNTTEKLVERLSKYPELQARVEQLLSIVENENRLTRADDAEQRVVEQMRNLGRELLTRWAKQESSRQEEAVLNSAVALKKSGKKNSIGTRPMER